MIYSEFVTCQDCSKVLYNSPKSINRHLRICADLDDEAQYLCISCRAGNCLCCDGGSCRCVCSLELDVRRIRNTNKKD
jgi:hypothetical protein